jgi:protein-S-isoprenylcysteine O-methyltransferase Ste14
MIIKFIIYSFLLLLFSYFVFRIIVRKNYLNKSKLTPLSYLLEMLVFALHANFIYLFVPLKWPDWPALPVNFTLRFVSIFLICVGLLILLIAWFKLGTGTSFGLDKNKLKTRGIYRYSRNPQLVGFGIIILGFIAWYFTWYSVGWFILYLVISWFMILSEEEFLKMKYEKEYENYCKKVPRIFRIL